MAGAHLGNEEVAGHQRHCTKEDSVFLENPPVTAVRKCDSVIPCELDDLNRQDGG